MLPGGETSTLEFKSCISRASTGELPEDNPDAGAIAVAIVKSKVGKYISAFLNSVGGCILFGIEDDGCVSGFVVSDTTRTLLIKAIDAAVGGAT